MIGVLGPGAAFAAGLASSTGPCIVPRLAAVTGMTADCPGTARIMRIGCFGAGSCLGYAVLASSAGTLRAIGEYSTFAYVLLATAFAGIGVLALLRRPSGHECRFFNPGSSVPLGTAFLAGGAFAVVGSPCCGPLAAALLAVSASSGSGWHLVALAFAAGHIVPLVALAAGWRPATAAVAARVPGQVVATIGGAVALGLAGYYALLA